MTLEHYKVLKPGDIVIHKGCGLIAQIVTAPPKATIRFWYEADNDWSTTTAKFLFKRATDYEIKTII